MQKWEYMILEGKTGKIEKVNGEYLPNWQNGPSLSEYLASLGNQGWEMVTMQYAPIFDQVGSIRFTSFCVAMKRPV